MAEPASTSSSKNDVDDLTGYEMIPTDWMEHAVCRGLDTNIFYPSRGEAASPAIAICATCPVTQQCADYAVAIRQKHGIWGGLTEANRRRIERPTKPHKYGPPHGTESRYHRGCRCQTCTEASTAATLQRRTQSRRSSPADAPNQPIH